VYANGALACWGGNDNGQLGLGDTKDRGDSAAPLSGLPRVDLGANVRVAEVALGERHTCARLTTGKVKCWGSGGDGQLGLDSQDKRGDGPNEMGDTLPEVNLGAGRTAVQIVAGASHTCARLDNGQLKCWGRNNTGQLGLGDTQFRGEQPGQMAALPAVDLGTGRTAVEIGAGNTYTCARLDNGQVKCWGANGEGELGNGLGTASVGFKAGQMGDNLTAVNLGTGRTASGLSVGFFHACAKLDNGQLKCWGSNSAGQLGQGDIMNRGTTPAQMGDNLAAINLGTGRTVKSISVGQEFNCAQLDNDALKCWGNSFYGQLGYGNTQKLGDAQNEMGDNLMAVDLGAGRTAKVLGVGSEHVCALLDNGKVKCWGANISAQLGNGSRNHVGDGPNEMGANLADTPLP
jgi:alpha-tubulin suppressor-like RCC1 family protein